MYLSGGLKQINIKRSRYVWLVSLSIKSAGFSSGLVIALAPSRLMNTSEARNVQGREVKAETAKTAGAQMKGQLMDRDHKMGMPPRFGPGGPMEEGQFQIPDADVSHVRRKWLDLPYAGISPARKLDIYLSAEGDGPFPVVLHIHGGGFAIGDKRDIHLMPFL